MFSITQRSCALCCAGALKKLPRKYNASYPAHDLYRYSGYLPTFGAGHDLSLHTGDYYCSPSNGQYNYDAKVSDLCGGGEDGTTVKFTPAEVEVFAVS